MNGIKSGSWDDLGWEKPGIIKTELDWSEMASVITGLTSELLIGLCFFVYKMGVKIHILYVSQFCFFVGQKKKAYENTLGGKV